MDKASQSDSARDLIARIDEEADKEAARILTEARQEARDIVAAAHRQARERIRQEIAQLRREAEQELARIRASFETERRQMRQARDLVARTEGLRRLGGILEGLWHDPEARRAWCDGILREARQRLMPGSWRVEHPADWPGAERDRIAEAIKAHTGEPARTREDPALTAGLRICADTACVDGSLAAITRDQARLSGLLLREMDAAENGEAE